MIFITMVKYLTQGFSFICSLKAQGQVPWISLDIVGLHGERLKGKSVQEWVPRWAVTSHAKKQSWWDPSFLLLRQLKPLQKTQEVTWYLLSKSVAPKTQRPPMEPTPQKVLKYYHSVDKIFQSHWKVWKILTPRPQQLCSTSTGLQSSPQTHPKSLSIHCSLAQMETSWSYTVFALSFDPLFLCLDVVVFSLYLLLHSFTLYLE